MSVTEWKQGHQCHWFPLSSQETLWGVDDGPPQHAEESEEHQEEGDDVHVGPAEQYYTFQWHHGSDRRRGRPGELSQDRQTLR